MEKPKRLSKRERHEMRKREAIKKRHKQNAIRSVIGGSIVVVVAIAVYFIR